jgi:hypothetical protein
VAIIIVGLAVIVGAFAAANVTSSSLSGNRSTNHLLVALVVFALGSALMLVGVGIAGMGEAGTTKRRRHPAAAVPSNDGLPPTRRRTGRRTWRRRTGPGTT